jgi:hypothetical protein
MQIVLLSKSVIREIQALPGMTEELAEYDGWVATSSFNLDRWLPDSILKWVEPAAEVALHQGSHYDASAFNEVLRMHIRNMPVDVFYDTFLPCYRRGGWTTQRAENVLSALEWAYQFLHQYVVAICRVIQQMCPEDDAHARVVVTWIVHGSHFSFGGIIGAATTLYCIRRALARQMLLAVIYNREDDPAARFPRQLCKEIASYIGRS